MCKRLVESSVNNIAKIAVMKLKLAIDRPRPYQIFPALIEKGGMITRRIPEALEFDFPLHSSFPSGHSTEAHFVACLLASICPNSEKQLIAEAGAIACNRQIAGLHYESDTAADKVLAKLLFEEFSNTVQYAEININCTCREALS